MIEAEQKIDNIQISEYGEVVVYSQKIRTRENEIELKIERLMNENLYSLSSIAKLCHCDINLLAKFIISQRFNFILHCFDPSFKIPNAVYFITFPDFVKIGRTFDLKQRYSPSELRDNVKRIVFVSDIATTEKELKTEFSKKYELFSEKSLERFKIRDIPRAIKLFDRIVEKHKTKKVENKHIKFFNSDEQIGTGYFVSPVAASVLISSFCNFDLNLCRSFIETVENFYRRIDKNDFVASFSERRERFQYWKFHGYIIIVNLNTEEVNISRLWKSAIGVDGSKITKSDKRLSKFLLHRNIQEFVRRNDLKIRKVSYEDRPLMNGKWAPVMFVHIILYELNSKYALKVSKMLTDMIFKRKIEIDPMSGGSRDSIRKTQSKDKNIKDLLARSFVSFN